MPERYVDPAHERQLVDAEPLQVAQLAEHWAQIVPLENVPAGQVDVQLVSYRNVPKMQVTHVMAEPVQLAHGEEQFWHVDSEPMYVPEGQTPL